MTSHYRGTAVITGASAGIGREYAIELAQRGMDVVLVARDQQRLSDLAESIRAMSNVRVEILVADLSDRVDTDKICQRVAEPDIALVINNAGFGLNQTFVDSDISDEQRLLDVLVTSVLRISHAALPGLIARGNGGLINVSSIAGWMTSGTYSAAKSWLTTFSQSLFLQCRGSGVHVIAVCPGFTRTEFQTRAKMSTETIPSWMWLEARDVVLASLQDFDKQHPVSVAGKRYKLMAVLVKYLPRRIVRAISSVSRKPN
ncbi:MAG: SDR family NAD(P)-dependent oxidoreductase [Actinobacteria bacterium]|uniref:Unannotated protein n=1 Tax=freshwater metagenome TaxID=449393 RepID=A0A6J5YL33_9ZZZZ|nr:SDR family NAD(P)-dependent oxidoreductase [Actinomycetota bacterium]